MEVRVLSVAIRRLPQDVYDFIVNPANLPQWARGFALSATKDEEGWVVTTSDGPVRIAFVDHNDLGVADHYVTLGDGRQIFNPMRVLPSGEGAEVTFTLFRSPDTSDERFAEDSRLVQDDLQTLRSVLERS